jgi:hypothetical protein
MNNATAETNKEEDNAICVLFYHPILGKIYSRCLLEYFIQTDTTIYLNLIIYGVSLIYFRSIIDFFSSNY